MAIDLDMSLQIRRPSDRVALVEAVLQAHPSDEAEWIEWKLDVELDRAEGQFKASRQILGFANRSPNDAARFLGGQAFLIVGAEPGQLAGTPRRDPAQLEDWLRPYLGLDGPIWDAHHVEMEGTEVLLIEVAAPRDGDPIHTLRRAFDKWHAGSVFVRHKGKTDPASPADMVMLTARSAAPVAGERVALEVTWARADPIIRALDLTEDSIDRLIEMERNRLLRPLDAPGSKSIASGNVQDESRMQRIAGWLPEDRKPDDYRNDVETYLNKLREAIPPVVVSQAIALTGSSIRLQVANPIESNFRRVQLVLHAGTGVIAFDPEDDNLDHELPQRPRPWGTRRPHTLAGLGYSGPFSGWTLPRSVVMGHIPRMWIENSGSTRIVFDAFDLRPRAVTTTDPFVLFASPGLAGKTVPVTWEATSTSADGVASGSLPLQVADDPLTLEELVGDPNRRT
ncbi:MAG TPA: hypothetical protein VGL16_09640 [Actinomycetota bacterium]